MSGWEVATVAVQGGLAASAVGFGAWFVREVVRQAREELGR